MRSPEIVSINLITAHLVVKDGNIYLITEKTQREINQFFSPDQQDKISLTTNKSNTASKFMSRIRDLYFDFIVLTETSGCLKKQKCQ
jgi:hypothetical protein